MLKYNHSLTKRLIKKEAESEVLMKWLLTLLGLDINSLTKSETVELEKAWSIQFVDADSKRIMGYVNELHEGLKLLLPVDHSQPKEWIFEVDEMNVHILRDPKLSDMSTAYFGNNRSMFLLMIGGILDQFGARLRRCKECSTIFFQVKSDQEYCSSQCAIRVRQRRFYAVHREEIKKKRREESEQKKPKRIYKYKSNSI